MSLRGKLEQTKAAKAAESQKQEQEEQQKKEAEQLQEKLQQEAAFKATFNKRNTLHQALEDLQDSRGELKTASVKRRSEFRNVKGLMAEIQKENPEEELPSFKEAVHDTDAGEDEQRYVEATKNVTSSIEDMRAKKGALKNLGIETDGLNDKDIETAVQSAYAEADQEVRAFAREHLDSELPEVREVQEEIIHEEAEKILGKMKGESFSKALSKGADRFLENFGSGEELKRRLKNYEPGARHHNEDHRKGLLMDELLRPTLQSVAKTEKFKDFIHSVSLETIGDALSERALAEALKRLTLNYDVDAKGVVSTRDYSETNEAKAFGVLAKMYETLEGAKVPEEYLYEDNSGFKNTVRPLIGSLFDESSFLKRFSREVLKLARLKKEEEEFPKHVDALLNKSQELSQLKKRESIEVLRNIEDAQQIVTKQQQAIENLERSLARAPFIDLDEYSAHSKISYSREQGWGDKKSITVGLFQEQLSLVDEQMRSRLATLKENVETAKSKYKDIQVPKKNWFNSKAVEAAETERKEAHNGYLTAERIADNPQGTDRGREKNPGDPEYIRLTQERERIVQRQQRVADQILEALPWLESYTKIEGETLKDFLEQAKEQIAKPLLQKMREQKEEAEKEVERLRGVQETLSANMSALEQELLEVTGYRSPDILTVRESMGRKKKGLEENIASVARTLQGDR